ncbi:MAG: hypothetical protein WA825_03750 [Steroidobacteraceae bacterium]
MLPRAADVLRERVGAGNIGLRNPRSIVEARNFVPAVAGMRCRYCAHRAPQAASAGCLEAATEFPLLVHCSGCGIYARPDESGQVLQPISALILPQYRGAVGRVQS